ncbi:MAG: hypothetical protein JXN60_09865 [Lentisphaerae bacterium]|nr:hypothetical protein [Lentisphaerota bacterium]
MTRRERLRRCYLHLETDRPAVYSRTGFPPDDPTYDRLKNYLKKHTEMKTFWSGCRFETPYSAETTKEPYSDDFERRIEILHTPKGDLRRSVLVSLKHEPSMHETFFINSADDAEMYLSLPLPQFGGDTSSFYETDASIGDAGIVDVYLGFNPGGFVVELCGSTTFAILSVTDRDVIHRLCERQMTIMLNRIKILMSNGIRGFFSMLGEEYIVPPLHGPVDFKDFNTKYDKPIIDLVHNAGGRMHVHSHGSIKKVFQDFVEMGVDVLHPFESPPQGDILTREAKQMARNKMCLEGNIQIDKMYKASADDIRQETEQLIADAFDDHNGLIVSPTASPYIFGKGEQCFPQYEAMISTVLDVERRN